MGETAQLLNPDASSDKNSKLVGVPSQEESFCGKLGPGGAGPRSEATRPDTRFPGWGAFLAPPGAHLDGGARAH